MIVARTDGARVCVTHVRLKNFLYNAGLVIVVVVKVVTSRNYGRPANKDDI